MPVKHKKTDTIANWTQAELDAQIALGNYPPGTLLADIVLPGDWNDDHNVLVTVAEIDATGTPSASTWLRGDGAWAGNPLGDVTGPAGATDNAVAVYDGPTGKIIKNSTALVSTTGTLILAAQSSVAWVAGGLFYDSTEDCFTAYNGNNQVAMQIGRELWGKCLNNSGVTIPNGKAVTITGASGGNFTIALAQANANIFVLGIATQAIPNGTTGEVTAYGKVNGVDTSAFAAGATLYVSATVAGDLTTTAPASPNYRIRVGTVGVSNATTGTIFAVSPTTTLGFGTANQFMTMNTAGTGPGYKTAASSTSITASLAAGTFNFQRAALTGDITAPANSNATTLATVNANVGTFGSATQVAQITVNAKGLVTAAANVTITNVTGNAATATALQTPRNISGVSFNGTANIDVPGYVTTANRAVVSNASGYTIASATTDTEISYVSGVTSAIQTQLNGKQGSLTLTTTGTSGAATLIGNTLNIPNYATGAGTVTSVSVVTANGVSGSVATATTTPAITLTLGAITPSSVAASGAVTGSNLSGTNTGDQTITLTGDITGSGTGSFATAIAAGVIVDADINAAAGITLSKLAAVTASRVLVSDASGFVSPSTVTTTTLGFLDATSSIQTQLNNKQASGNYITSLTGEATASGPGAAAVTLTNSAVIGKVLTGYVSGAGAVAATDTILQAVQKLNGNDALKAPIANPTFTGTLTAPTVNVSGLTASQSVQTDASKNLVSLANTGTGNNVLATSPTLVTPVLGTPASGTLTNCTGLTIVGGTTGTLSVARGGTGVTTSRPILQQAQTVVTSSATGTTTVPSDNTIPQITEGDQYMSFVFTPQSATSTLIIEYQALLYSNTANGSMVVSLFDGGSNSLSTVYNAVYYVNGAGGPIYGCHVKISGTTSAITFSVRAGKTAASTTSFNGPVFGGTLNSFIQVTEIA